jgi:hypothetical protein
LAFCAAVTAVGVHAAESRTDAIAARATALAGSNEIGSLIALLDAPQFQARDGATQRLAEKGPAVIPDLIAALGDPSAEVRFRASVLLSRHHSFEQVAPQLIGAVETHYGPRARLILRERSLQQLEAVCQLPYTDKLLKFWGTNVEAFCNQAVTRLNDAADLPQTRQAVEPLLGLAEKTTQFNEAISQLEALSLSYDHQYSPGYVIAETLACGLAANHRPWIAFAERYLQSLQQLVADLRAQETAKYAIHKEVLDRANMSQGAASFLVKLLDGASPLRPVLVERLGISPEELEDAFCLGLAAVDPRACDRGVGKVHVVDMLIESQPQWIAAPPGSVRHQLVVETMDAAKTGDKPKALALLDALEACSQLSDHQLQADAGYGKQLADRLHQAARLAPNNRAFHPTQSVHNKLVALADLQITPAHTLFPDALWRAYLDRADSVTSDEGRLALERYVRVIDRLRATGADLEESGVRRFLYALRDGLAGQHDFVAAGVAHLDQILRTADSRPAGSDSQSVGPRLSAWLDSVQAADEHK